MSEQMYKVTQVYRSIEPTQKNLEELNKLKKLSKKDGKMILEVGLGSHPIKAFNIFNSLDFNKIDLTPDYNGDLRVLKIEI